MLGDHNYQLVESDGGCMPSQKNGDDSGGEAETPASSANYSPISSRSATNSGEKQRRRQSFVLSMVTADTDCEFGNASENMVSDRLSGDSTIANDLDVTRKNSDSYLLSRFSMIPATTSFDSFDYLTTTSPVNHTQSSIHFPSTVRSGRGMAKRKYGSVDLGSSSPFIAAAVCRSGQLPTFVSHVPDMIGNAPTPRLITNLSLSNEFATPAVQQVKKGSRPNSPSGNVQRPVVVPSRSRIASIRRESDCSVENEAAHEKLVKTAQQVSLGFEDFCLDEKLFDERKRAKSLTEPISIFTNAFLPQSSSPSPTRIDNSQQKQCYSPSTQQVVRSNISYSPSPSPTPSSPTRNRIMRSMSPIAVRQISKRRYTGSGNGSGMDSDGESSSNSLISVPVAKRQCTTPRSAASPLIRDPLLQQMQTHQPQFYNNQSVIGFPDFSMSPASSSSGTFGGDVRCCYALAKATSSSSSSSSNSNIVVGTSLATSTNGNFRNGGGRAPPPRLLIDASLTSGAGGQICNSPSCSIDLDETNGGSLLMDDDQLPCHSFCSSSLNDNNSSTTFSSRAGTPMEEQLNETDLSFSSLFNQSSNSSRGSSLALKTNVTSGHSNGISGPTNSSSYSPQMTPVITTAPTSTTSCEGAVETTATISAPSTVSLSSAVLSPPSGLSTPPLTAATASVSAMSETMRAAAIMFNIPSTLTTPPPQAITTVSFPQRNFSTDCAKNSASPSPLNNEQTAVIGGRACDDAPNGDVPKDSNI